MGLISLVPRIVGSLGFHEGALYLFSQAQVLIK